MERKSKITQVKLGHCKKPPFQRNLRAKWADTLHGKFDLDLAGLITVSRQAPDWCHILDGQHRFEAYKQFLGAGWEDQLIDCVMYDNLTTAEEAQIFVECNQQARLAPVDTYIASVTAGYDAYVQVNRRVERAGLAVSRGSGGENTLRCVGALMNVARIDIDLLEVTLKFVNRVWGSVGLKAEYIEGTAMFLAKYQRKLDLAFAETKIARHSGGISHLRQLAQLNRESFGVNLKEGFGIALRNVYCKPPQAKKLDNWFQS